MHVRPLLLLAALAAALSSTAHAQTLVRGRVTDAETGEGLPAATVQVEGTSRGTVANREGEYELAVPVAEGGAHLIVRFLGFETARRPVPPGGGRLDVALAPAVGSLGEAVVTAGDPAENVMRRVIERKARWRAGLRTWRAEVYSRRTVRADGEVVAITEAQTEAYWDRERGLREIVKATRRTGNLDALPPEVFAAAEDTYNLYDDDVEVLGYTLMGPTHPRALSFYRFTVEGRRALGDRPVYDLSFRPRNPLQPGFEGTLSVLAGADAVLAVAVRLSGAVQVPTVNGLELTAEQQFSPFGQEVGGEPVWLPADFRLSARGRPGTPLLQFPPVGFDVASRFTDYAVNVALPDSLFEREGVAVDSAAVAETLPEAGVVPLSDEEKRALAEIDSTRSLADAFQPTGPLARFVRVDIGDEPEDEGRGLDLAFDPAAGYNRVEGARLGARVTAQFGRASATAGAAYQTAAEDVALSGAAALRLGRGAEVGLDLRREIAPLAESFYVGPLLNGAAALVAGEDYFDYARRTGGEVWAGWRGRGERSPSVRLGAAYDDYDAVPVRTRYALLGGALPADNAVVDGRALARAGLRLALGEAPGGVFGGLAGGRSGAVSVEVGRAVGGADGGPPTAGPTDPYLRLEGDARWSIPTVLRRRLLPPTLHLRVAAGTATSALPLARSFGVDGQFAGLAPFGALRSRTGRLALARRYALVAWEHDFRAVPFEALGWRGAAPLGLSVLVHGAHAWADGAPEAVHVEPSVVHHEVGLSLGLGYTVPVRVDATVRLTDSPAVVLGVGLARLF